MVRDYNLTRYDYLAFYVTFWISYIPCGLQWIMMTNEYEPDSQEAMTK